MWKTFLLNGIYMDKKTLWKAVLAELEVDTSRASYNAWLRPTQLEKSKGVDKKRQIVTIACRTPYQRTMVEARYYGQIKQALDRITELHNELVFTVKPVEVDSVPAGPIFEQIKERQERSAYDDAVEKIRLKKDYVFESFAVSSTNEMAHAAASAVAREPGRAYHLLFLYGGVGVGKTHLMTAVGHEILKVDPGVEMVFCSGEEFMNDLVQAIQTKKTAMFRARYRKIKVFLVDDIQFIAGKDAVQEEFFHTFNAIVQNRGQIILTSDKLPEEMVLLEDRLRSRFEGGLTIDIQEPNLELRTAILNIKSKARGLSLPADVTQLIANEVRSTRKLEGVLARLTTYVAAKNEPVTLESVLALFGKDAELTKRPQKYVPPAEVIGVVAEYFSLKPSALKGKRRTKEVVSARHLAMYLLRVDLEVPLKEVGRVFGGRDHTTVMHAVDKVERELKTSEKFRGAYTSTKKGVFG